MLPNATQARPETRKRSLPPARGQETPPPKIAAPDSAAGHSHISRLQDLPVEIHSGCFGHMPLADVVQYGQALSPPLALLPEPRAAALRLQIRAAETVEELQGLATHLGTVDPAFRAAVIHDMLGALQDIAQRAPLDHAIRVAGPLQGCHQATAGLPGWHARRLRQRCHQIEICLGLRKAHSTSTLLALLAQVPRLPPAAQCLVLVDALRAIERLLRIGPLMPPSLASLEDAMLRALDLARVLPPEAQAAVLHAGFQAYSEAVRQIELQSWPRAWKALVAQSAALPPAAFHQALPIDDDQFVDTVGTWMEPLAPPARLAIFDALMEAVPVTGRERLLSLGNMAAVLSEVPGDAILPRVALICQQLQALDPALAHRENVFLELATDSLFDALPAGDTRPVFELLIDAMAGCHLAPFVLDSLLDELEGCIDSAPAHEQPALRQRLQAAREA